MADPVFYEEQIVSALRQAEAGSPVEKICNDLNISRATFDNWKRRYSGLSVPDLRRLIPLERDVARLGKLVNRLIIGTRWALLIVAIIGVRAALQS